MIIKRTFPFVNLQIFFLTLSAFIIGALNAREYTYLFGAGYISRLAHLSLLIILFIIFLIFPRAMLFRHKRSKVLRFIIPLFLIVLLKYFVLFLTSPHEFLGGGIGIGLSGVFSSGERYFVELFYFLIIFLSLIFFVCSIRNTRELAGINFYLVLGCAVAPAIGFIFFPNMVGTRVAVVEGVSFSGGFWNSSIVGMVTTFWFSLCLMEYYFKKQAVLLWLLLGVIIMGALVGLSRTAFVSLGSSLLVYFFLSRSFSKRIWLLLLFLAVSILILRNFDLVLYNMQSRLGQHSNLLNESRILIWQDYLAHISEYWMFGVSTEGYRVFSMEYMGPHSIFLNWLVRFGIVGLLGFLWLLYGVFLSVKKIRVYFSRERYARVMAWTVSYITLVAYNETGFQVPSLYAIFAFIFVLAEIGQEKQVVAGNQARTKQKE